MQRRQEILNDITDTVGAAFLGLTYGCARCHDHKFDPILQKDYYRLQAFFANTRIEDDGRARLRGRERDDVPAASTPPGKRRPRDIRARDGNAGGAAALKAMYKESFDKFPAEIQEAITTAPDKRTPIQWQMYYKAKPQLEH